MQRRELLSGAAAFTLVGPTLPRVPFARDAEIAAGQRVRTRFYLTGPSNMKTMWSPEDLPLRISDDINRRIPWGTDTELPRPIT